MITYGDIAPRVAAWAAADLLKEKDMGCDIHMYLEYTNWNGSDGEPWWQCFVSNAGSRDYRMFNILAGVRGDDLQLFPPRGMPEGRLSFEVDGSIHITVDDANVGIDGYCTEQQAKDWREDIREDGKRRYIQNPDYHSASWLTREEYARCLAKHQLDVGDGYNVEYDVMLAAMQSFEDHGAQTRLVFWFDN